MRLDIHPHPTEAHHDQHLPTHLDAPRCRDRRATRHLFRPPAYVNGEPARWSNPPRDITTWQGMAEEPPSVSSTSRPLTLPAQGLVIGAAPFHTYDNGQTLGEYLEGMHKVGTEQRTADGLAKFIARDAPRDVERAGSRAVTFQLTSTDEHVSRGRSTSPPRFRRHALPPRPGTPPPPACRGGRRTPHPSPIPRRALVDRRRPHPVRDPQPARPLVVARPRGVGPATHVLGFRRRRDSPRHVRRVRPHLETEVHRSLARDPRPARPHRGRARRLGRPPWRPDEGAVARAPTHRHRAAEPAGSATWASSPSASRSPAQRPTSSPSPSRPTGSPTASAPSRPASDHLPRPVWRHHRP